MQLLWPRLPSEVQQSALDRQQGAETQLPTSRLQVERLRRKGAQSLEPVVQTRHLIRVGRLEQTSGSVEDVQLWLLSSTRCFCQVD